MTPYIVLALTGAPYIARDEDSDSCYLFVARPEYDDTEGIWDITNTEALQEHPGTKLVEIDNAIVDWTGFNTDEAHLCILSREQAMATYPEMFARGATATDINGVNLVALAILREHL